jgi:uncharacterized membrane protein YdjX (TVP38/TMEM64 family)
MDPLMSGALLMSCLWNKKRAFTCIFFPVLLGVVYLINYDFQYLVNSGVSILNRQDVSSIQRFLYSYGARGPLVHVILAMLGVLFPHLGLKPLLQAGALLFGMKMGTLCSWIGGSLGILFLLSIAGCFKAGYIIAKKKWPGYRDRANCLSFRGINLIVLMILIISVFLPFPIYWLVLVFSAVSHASCLNVAAAGSFALLLMSLTVK